MTAKLHFVKKPFILILLLAISAWSAKAATASWHGEELRGRLMANGQSFDPDNLTAAPWFYPFGSKGTVSSGKSQVTVNITDSGPSKALVRQGRLMDLSRAAFSKLANPTNPRNIIKVSINQAKEATFRPTITRKT